MPPVLVQPVVGLCEDASVLSAVLERACHAHIGLLLVGLYSHLSLFPLVLSLFAGEELPAQGNFLGVEILLVNATSWIATYRVCHWA